MSELQPDQPAGTTTADREAFLARIRARQGPPTTSGPHPPPAPLDVVPDMAYRSLDGIAAHDRAGLLEVFVDAARTAEATVEVVPIGPDGPAPEDFADVVSGLVARYEIRRAVVSAEPETAALVAAVRGAGVEVETYDRETAAAADLAITSATHAIAATGSLVVDAATAGSRAVSLLPRVHLAVVSADRIVSTPAAVLRGQQRPMPSCRVLVTGPSRTGDIEQLLTLGAHGPVALHVVVLSDGAIRP